METKEMLKREEVLKKKIIKVEPIVRSRSFFKKGHDGEFMYTGCRRIYTLPFDSAKRSFFNPFLKEGEQEFFEKQLNQKEGALNLYDSHSKFWGSFTTSLDKNGLELDLSNPSDALRYRVMLVDPKFANGEDQRDVPECEFILIDQEITDKAISEKAQTKDKAMDYMYKLKKSKKGMYDTLRLLGKKPDVDASADWFKTEIYKILDEPGILPGTVGLKQFIEVMEDSLADVKIFVLDAVEKGEIVQGNDGYRIADGRKYLGKDITQVYHYFADGGPEAKEEKIIIEQRLKN
jgi:hypothetical protein